MREMRCAVKSADKQELLRTRLERLQPGDHVCLLHETSKEWCDFVAGFVRGGILREEKVVLLSGKNSPCSVMELLRQEGLEPARRIYEGQLVLSPVMAEFDTGEFFCPERFQGFLRRKNSSAAQAGYSRISVAADMTSVVRESGSEGSLLRYEASLADFFSTHNAIVACQYDRAAFSDDFLISVLDLHPIVVTGGRVLENRIFYSPFHETSGPAAASSKLEGRLRVLNEWNHVDGKFGEGFAWIQKLAGIAPVGVFMMDPLGNCTYVNEQWSRICGMSSDEAMGMGWTRTIDPEDAEGIVSGWMRAVAAGRDFEGEGRIRASVRRLHPDRELWVSVRARTLRGESGEITGYLGVLQDLGTRLSRHRELVESQAWLSSVFRSLPAAVSAMDVATGCFLDVNEAFEGFTGFSRREALGRTATELGLFDERELARAHELLLGSSAGALPLTLTNRAGAKRPVSASHVLIGSRGGPCILSVFTPAE